jgi:type IV pilus assembly protein PilE
MINRGEQRGMTLIELMVTAAIVAIIAGIAYPSYQDQVRRSRRAAATAWLMDLAAREQQRFVDVRAYANDAALGLATPADIAPHYAITITVPTPNTFIARATPSGAQAKDKCGVLAIDQAGAKTAGSVARADCW